MSYHTIAVQKVRHIVPDEAQAIADELRAIAEQAGGLAAQLRSIGGNLARGGRAGHRPVFSMTSAASRQLARAAPTGLRGRRSASSLLL